MPHNNQNGNAMVIVLCILCLMTALSLSLLLAAASLGNAQRRNENTTVCRAAAFSLSELLNEEFCAERTEDMEPSGLQQAVISMLLSDTELHYCHDKKTCADTWKYRIESTDGILSDSMDGCVISLAIYWGDIYSDFRESLSETQTRQWFDGASLYLEISCQKGQEAYTICQEYAITVLEKEENYEWKFQLLSQKTGQND